MLKRLREANLAREAERNPEAVASLLFRAVELGGEAGEALNVVKKFERQRLGIAGSTATLEELADELADVLICVDLVALTAGIDLEAALVRKFNASSENLGVKTRM